MSIQYTPVISIVSRQQICSRHNSVLRHQFGGEGASKIQVGDYIGFDRFMLISPVGILQITKIIQYNLVYNGCN